MTQPGDLAGGTDSDPAHQGMITLTALGIAASLVVAAGVVGVAIGMRGTSHGMMWGGTITQIERAAPATDRTTAAVQQATPTGFQIDGLPAMMVRHYGIARANPDVYAQIPCFCGCQDMLGHRNLEDCFVTPDGAWESHASGCQVCIDESQMVTRMMGRGVDPGSMHDRIVASFGGPMTGTTS